MSNKLTGERAEVERVEIAVVLLVISKVAMPNLANLRNTTTAQRSYRCWKYHNEIAKIDESGIARDKKSEAALCRDLLRASAKIQDFL